MRVAPAIVHYNGGAMRRLRQFGVVIVACGVSALVVAVVLPFLAPDLSYRLKERVVETLSGRGNRPIRIALGVKSGSYFRLGAALNKYLKEKAGYELELVPTNGIPENVGAMLDAAQRVDLATIESSFEGANGPGLSGLAAVGRQYFFVMVPDNTTFRDFSDLAGDVNPGARAEGEAPTLGERVLDFYGLLVPPTAGPGLPSPVTIVRPTGAGVRTDFESGRAVAYTRTQFLHPGLIDDWLAPGGIRLLPIRDHQALAQALPGTEAAFIPAGSYGPRRRVPTEPVPTLSVSTLLISRTDLPARVVRDILDVVYDPRFAREIQQDISETSGRNVGELPLHPAADIYYRRHDQVTSDRIGRITFVASVVAAAFTAVQFVRGFRRNERRQARRKLLAAELEKLDAIRRRIESADPMAARALVADADDLLSGAEQDAAADLLDPEGIQSLRSLHGLCWRALQDRRTAPPPVASPSTPPESPAKS